MEKDKQKTAQASEFYILSLLNRVGCDAFLTLGNAKKIDIVVKKGNQALTIDVKGGINSFPLNESYKETVTNPNHYYIFVNYTDFGNYKSTPFFYVVLAKELSFVRQYDSSNRYNVLLSDLKDKFSDDLSIFKSDSDINSNTEEL